MHEPSAYEVEPPPPRRAGLRAPAHEPPRVFAAVELAVLVIVTTLAMVSIIVSANADASQATPRDAGRTQATTRPAAASSREFSAGRHRTSPLVLDELTAAAPPVDAH